MRTLLIAVATLISGAVLVTVYVILNTGPDFKQPDAIVSDPRISQPADIVRFKGRYVAAELYQDRLVVFDDLNLSNLSYFDPRQIGESFNAPHYLAVTPSDTLLISNGWGNSIVEIADLDGRDWREFNGVGKQFDAPHGICVDDEGWIYVGDSLNSRLVRFRDMNGDGWQVFPDHDRVVSYIRELVCENGEIWVSNSYENRDGLNPGQGANILRISDFESGGAEVVLTFPHTNITSLAPIGRFELLVGEWGAGRRLVRVDTRNSSATVLPRLALGTPYGTYVDNESKAVIVTYIGTLSREEKTKIGGLAIYRH